MTDTGLDITQLTIRMSRVKLLDLDFGHLILSKLNAASGDEDIFKIEMSGDEIKLTYGNLPLAMRRELDKVILLDSQQAIDTIKDIEKTIKHQAEIEKRDVATVEAYISIISIIATILAFSITLLYNAVTDDARMSYPRYVSNAFEMLIENMYQRHNEPVAPQDNLSENE